MLDIRQIRENPDRIKAAMKKRCLDLDTVVDDILKIDAKTPAKSLQKPIK